MRLFGTILLFAASLFLAGPAQAQLRVADRFLTTTDGVRLHYIDTGAVGGGPVLVFIPGWTMPGWIFDPQIKAFSPHYRVIVLDPRGQGESDVPTTGYTYTRRGEDIANLVGTLGNRVVLIGWSLGVLDALAYVHAHGDAALAGLVLVDNSVGEDPPPTPSRQPYHRGPRQTHATFMAGFVKSMFRRTQAPAYLQQLTEAALRTPESAANALLSYAVPRSYWKEAIYSTDRPVLYLVRPGLAGQASNLAAHHPGAESVVLPDLGHAMFVDDPGRFDSIVQSFLTRRLGG